MTAATQDLQTPQEGAIEDVYPVLLAFGVEANTIIYGGTMVAINANGNAVPASASGALKLVGRCERQVNNLTSNTPYGAAGAQNVTVHQGVFYFNVNADSTITTANFGANLFASDDNTVSLFDAGGTRPYAGVLLCGVVGTGIAGISTPGAGKVPVFVGVANPYAANPEISASSPAFKARAVLTSIAAYLGSGTGTLTVNTVNTALGTQDGISTLAVGDVVFLQEGTTNITAAKDAGPYTINSLGATNNNGVWVLTRPDWWATNSVLQLSQSIDIGGEGTAWHGTSWRSFAAKGSAVVDTNDPKLYPGRVTVPLTLVNSVATLNTVPLFSATTTFIGVEVTNSINAVNTVTYGTNAAFTPGVLGTATATILALQTGMLKSNSNDNSAINVLITNW